MPAFDNTGFFLAFNELPSSPEAGPGEDWFLLAQIKENMTITKPTLIITDRTGLDFAIIFEDKGLSLKGFKKGYTIAVPRAVRTDREEGKKAIVRVDEGRGGDAKVIPGPLAQVLELGQVMDIEGFGDKCAACGNVEGPLMKCTGCGTASYCSKTCQVKGWGEMGHKSNCKVIKSIKEIWR
ncbi:hypothetical protein F4779DRAFT_15794 [Xylariaceae sp. FL0662B]|nr:hypothetical protein F4779DRAFT_15794 [Xylariaceae sp. FL0662B]